MAAARSLWLRSFHVRSADLRGNFPLSLKYEYHCILKPNSYFLIVTVETLMCKEKVIYRRERFAKADTTHRRLYDGELLPRMKWWWTAHQTHRRHLPGRNYRSELQVRYQTLTHGWGFLPPYPSSFLSLSLRLSTSLFLLSFMPVNSDQ